MVTFSTHWRGPLKPVIEDTTLQLVGGMMDVVTSLVITLEAQGALNREALAYVIERRLEDSPPDALSAAPMAILYQWLRPSEPPRPQLRLIQGGKAQ